MKKITLPALLLLTCTGFSQNAPITFEPGENGSAWTFTVFENATNPAVEIVANPSQSGLNTSATAAKFTALQSGQPYAGCESLHGSDIGTFTLSASNAIVKVMVYKSVVSDVGIKFSTPSGDSSGEIKVANTQVNQWEELTFDFTGIIGIASSSGIDQLIIFPDFNSRTSDNVVYFDNITFTNGSVDPFSEPVVAAPNPVLPQSDVISMFSNTYANVPVDTWHTGWSDAVLEDVQIAGNDTKKYSALNFVGIETVASQIDATDMAFFNLNVWSPDFTVFKVKLVDFGADAAFGGGDDTEHEITFNNPVQGQWITYHIPLSDFENLAARHHIAQLIFVGGGKKVYIDNVYFSNEAVIPPAPTDPVVAAPDPVLPQSEVISMFSNAYADVPVDTWHTSWSDATLANVQIAGNDTKKYTSLNFVGIETVSAQLNITDMNYFHVDVWSPDFTVFKVKLVDFGANGAFGGGDDVEHELTFNNPAQGQWISYNIPVSDFTGLVTREHIAQLIFVGGGKKVFVDNVYFSTSALGVNTENIVKTIMYPNPAQGSVHFSNAENISEISIFNMLGQQVVSAKPGQKQASLDISSLTKGVYLVSTTVNGKTDSVKLLIR